MGNRIITCLSVCQTSKILAYGSSDNHLRIWDSREKTRNDKDCINHKTFSSHNGWVSSISWCPTSDYVLASGAYDGSIKVWDTRTETPISTNNHAHKGKVMCMSWL